MVILPSKLCRKRYWSKKYPICLKGVKLQNSKRGATNITSSSTTPPNDDTSKSTASTPRDENTSIITELDNSTLILFARTDREKEEWYNLFRKVRL